MQIWIWDFWKVNPVKYADLNLGFLQDQPIKYADLDLEFFIFVTFSAILLLIQD